MSDTYKKTEKKLRDYLTGNLDARIQFRKDILKYPPKPSIKQPTSKEEKKAKKKKEALHEVVIKTNNPPRKDKLESEVIRYLDDSKYNRLQIERNAIREFLTRLMGYDYTTYKILVLFYRDKNTWAEVSEKVCSSETTCKRRRKEAVSDLESILVVDWSENGLK